MNYIFWQGVLSIHQSSFIKALSESDNVTLVVSKELSETRKSQGWAVPNMGNANIIINPTKNEVIKMINLAGVSHVFSGFSPFPLAVFAINELHKKNKKFVVILESFEWRGVKGILRYIKYYIIANKFRKSINRLFVTGTKAEEEYIRCGFKKNTIKQWGYFTEQKNIKPIEPNGNFKIVFIGTLNTNKNIELLINTCLKLNEIKLDIIGEGPLSERLKNSYSKYDWINFYGNIPNDSINKILISADVLILPSQYDGWGAVVNESLSVGTPVIASINCGASILIDESGERGLVTEPCNLESAIRLLKDKGKTTLKQRNAIRKWATDNLSGKVASNYFNQAMGDENAIAPWLK